MPAEAVVVSRAYALVQQSIPIVQRFPKAHRFSLGVRVENELYDLLMDLVSAQYDREGRASLLRSANLRVQRLRFLWRLATDFRLCSVGAYEAASRALDDVGRQIGGWSRSVSR